ncbi:uncharacterized protein LOC122856258 [Aphidius gifuensis]|uniref:uncharacterized protein LOC122856258 n=1 Tax=Aphidius gifuensis TaxID=684658 RepID=UPI001CDBFBA3|nr:uncharacterized protein LOC122856258 [Aphidius gifuensis]
MSLINVSDSTPSLPDSEGYASIDDDDLASFEKAEADYVESLMEVLSSAVSICQVKQILSDKEKLSEDMQEVFDRAINQEKKEQKQASEVPIKRIINKIRIMKKRERQYELLKLLRKNEAELKKTDYYVFNTLVPQSERKERQVFLDIELALLTEYLWIKRELNPRTDEYRAKLSTANSWPDYPEFEDTQESDMDVSDSDESADLDESDSSYELNLDELDCDKQNKSLA